MYINNKIVLLRKQRKMTQRQLAQKLGVTAQAVSKWESSQSCPDIQLLPLIAGCFGISIDQLLGWEPFGYAAGKRELNEGSYRMITLRKASFCDADILAEHGGMSKSDALKMIGQSEDKSFGGRFFEMYVIVDGESIVGLVSLYEHTPSVISIGPEVFEEYRRSGYATRAMQIAIETAKSNGYKIVCQQVRTDNVASIRLHSKLGFETDNVVYKNRKQNDVFIYLKSIR